MLHKVYWNNSVGSVLSIETQSQGNQQGFCLSNLLPIKAQEIEVSQTIKTQLLKQRAIKSMSNKRLWMSTDQPHPLTHMEAEVQRGNQKSKSLKESQPYTPEGQSFCFTFVSLTTPEWVLPTGIHWLMDGLLIERWWPALLVVGLRGSLTRTQPQVIDLVLS